MNLWWAIAAGGVGSILGDQIGYAIGRWAGPAVVARLSRVFGKRANLEAMEAKVKAWGGPGSLCNALADQSPGTLDQSRQRDGSLPLASIPLLGHSR